MKGIVLAGGSGRRMGPIGAVVNKHLLPIYDRPMIEYPLSTLARAGITEVLLITSPAALPQFIGLLGDAVGPVRLSYETQESPAGVAEALIIGAAFAAGAPVCLILGDNLFYGDGLTPVLREAATHDRGALVFGRRVPDPRDYGVVELDDHGRATSLEEKPAHPRGSLIIPGMYFYDREAADLARGLVPSPRGELEITDLNREYLRAGRLHVRPLPPSVGWMDVGNPDALLAASNLAALWQSERGRHITREAP